MSRNRLPQLTKNGVRMPNEELLTPSLPSKRHDISAISQDVRDDVVDLVRKYPAQAVTVGILFGAVVAILLRKLR